MSICLGLFIFTTVVLKLGTCNSNASSTKILSKTLVRMCFRRSKRYGFKKSWMLLVVRQAMTLLFRYANWSIFNSASFLCMESWDATLFRSKAHVWSASKKSSYSLSDWLASGIKLFQLTKRVAFLCYFGTKSFRYWGLFIPLALTTKEDRSGRSLNFW